MDFWSIIWIRILLLCMPLSFAADDTIQLPTGVAMKPCDNLIVKSIPGNFTTVLNIGKKYAEMMLNDTSVLEPFSGRWKWEPDRVLREPLRVFNDKDQMINECSTMKVFGDEKKNYDEAKRYFIILIF